MRWLLIDRLEKCTPGQTATAIKCFSRSDIIFMDHLRGEPLVPGVLLVEMVANTASYCYRLLHPETSPTLGVIKNAKFYRPVIPGDRCVVTVKIETEKTDYIYSTGSVLVDDTKVAEISLISVIKIATHTLIADPVLEDWKKLNP